MGSTDAATSRTLLMLDCDHTIIDGNSDTWILSLLPDRAVPASIKQRYKTGHKSWTMYMGEIFEYMHSMGIKEKAIHDCIAEIPLVAGMKDLIEYQQTCERLDCIVVSDANSFFIDVVLGSRDLLGGIQRIFTNPADFDPQGCLKIYMAHPHNCPRQCPRNLCKQAAISTFIEEQRDAGITYSRVCVIGDGNNDLCPCLSLGEGDFAFPRKGYSLIKRLQELAQGENGGKGGKSCMRATVLPWESATEILDVLKSII